jgi:hypothetical protein
MDGDNLLVLSPSNEIYRANCTCECKAFTLGQPCWHRAAARYRHGFRSLRLWLFSLFDKYMDVAGEVRKILEPTPEDKLTKQVRGALKMVIGQNGGKDTDSNPGRGHKTDRGATPKRPQPMTTGAVSPRAHFIQGLSRRQVERVAGRRFC